MMKKNVLTVVKAFGLVAITYALSWLAAFLYDEYLFSQTVCILLVYAISLAFAAVFYLISRKQEDSTLFATASIVISMILLLCLNIIVDRISHQWGISGFVHFFSHQVPFIFTMIAACADLCRIIIKNVTHNLHNRKKSNNTDA